MHDTAYEVVCDASHADWLAERRLGVSASNIATIMGRNPYEKRSRDQIIEDLAVGAAYEDRPAMWLGRVLEPYVAEKAAELYPQWRLAPLSKLLRSKKWPWLLATPDGTRTHTESGESHVGDIKCHDRYTVSKWAAGPPEMYIIQVQVQIAVCDAVGGFVLEQCWGSWPRYHDVPRDNDLIADVVKASAEAWRDICLIREMKESKDGKDKVEIDTHEVSGSGA